MASNGNHEDRLGLLGLLRIFTPIVIAKMTKISTGVRKIRLTDVLNGKESLGFVEAQKEQDQDEVDEISKVIPLKANEKSTSKENTQMIDQKVAVGSGIQSSGIKSKNSNLNIVSEKNQDLIEKRIISESESLKNLELGQEEAKLSSIGIKSQKEIREQEKIIEIERNKKKESTSVFILNEKKNLDQAQKKLKKMEVLDTYSSTMTLKIDQEESKKDGEKTLEASQDSGALINKKQY